MEKVIVVVNAKIKLEGKLIASPVTEKMIQSTMAAIKQDNPDRVVTVVTPALLRHGSEVLHAPHYLLPLTLQIPSTIAFPAREVFLACQDVQGMRDWVEQKLNLTALSHHEGLGDRWLPAIVSTTDLCFGELIGEGAIPNAYQQPVEIADRQKRSLHSLAKKLLNSLNAPPAVYLLQVRLTPSQVLFDRLWPFPAAPAIASLHSANSDLYHLHWQCVQQQQLVEI